MALCRVQGRALLGTSIMNNKKRKVLIAAGGTGGHLFPAQQLAAMLDAEVQFAGYKIGTSPFFEKEKIGYTEIAAHPLGWGFILSVWSGFWQAVKAIRYFAPDVVVGFGSYHVFPVLLAAVCMRKKLVIFEANYKMGKVNRFFSFFASAIASQFPLEEKKAVLVHWLPWKKEEKRLEGREAKKLYGLDPDTMTILVFGGSQGASFLNEMAPKAIEILGKKIQAIHLTGLGSEETVRATYERLGIRAAVKPFEKEMAFAYAAADLALCRSGAGTIAELIRYELPALLIPYPFATEDHQKKNGDYLVGRGGARLVVQREASIERLSSELETLIGEREERRERLKMGKSEDLERIHLADVVERLG